VLAEIKKTQAYKKSNRPVSAAALTLRLIKIQAEFKQNEALSSRHKPKVQAQLPSRTEVIDQAMSSKPFRFWTVRSFLLLRKQSHVSVHHQGGAVQVDHQDSHLLSQHG